MAKKLLLEFIMSNEGTNVREDMQVGHETTTESSIFPHSLENDNLVLKDIIFNYFNPSSSSAISPLHHHHNQQQQEVEGPSTGPVSQIVPSFGGELENSLPTPISGQDFNSVQELEHLYEFMNVEMEGNFEELFDVALHTAQGPITALPTPNSTSELMLEASPTVQPPPLLQQQQQQPYSNPLGAATGASSSSFPTAQTTLAQQPKSGQGKRTTKGKTQSQLLSSLYPLAMPNNTQNQVPNTDQQGFLGAKPTPDNLKIGGPSSSSSRNVKMKMTLSDNVQQLASIQVSNPPVLPNNNQQLASIQVSNPPTLLGNGQQLAPIQIGSFQNPPVQGYENPPQSPRTLQNSFYDPIYEQMGIPVDLTLRMYLASKRNKGGS